MNPSDKIVRVRIGGRVQGVGFRAFVQRHAEGRGVSGWVRNSIAGDVEAVFAGPAHAVDALCDACRLGPEYAEVKSLEIFSADLSALSEAGDLSGFRQIATK